MPVNFQTLEASLVFYGLNALYATVLLVVGWYLAGLAQGFVSRAMIITHQIDPLVTAFVSSLARATVLAFVGIAVLQLFGIETASLVAVLGATSLAIGLALQGTLSHFAAGVMLLLFRPFRIGDEVEIAGKFGKVQSLSLFLTELIASDNTQILLPNGSVWGAAIINHSAYPGTGELKVSFPVSAGQAAQTVGNHIVSYLRDDPRLGPHAALSVHVSKVIDATDPDRAVLELTVSARVNPTDAGAIKQELLDRIGGALVGLASGKQNFAQPLS